MNQQEKDAQNPKEKLAPPPLDPPKEPAFKEVGENEQTEGATNALEVPLPEAPPK